MNNKGNENATYENLWDGTKSILRRKFILLKCIQHKKEKVENYLNIHSRNWKINSKLIPKEKKKGNHKKKSRNQRNRKNIYNKKIDKTKCGSLKMLI